MCSMFQPLHEHKCKAWPNENKIESVSCESRSDVLFTSHKKYNRRTLEQFLSEIFI